MENLKKKILLIVLLGFVSFFIISCEKSNETTEPEKTTETPIEHSFNMDTIYFQGEGYDITYGDLYSSIVINDGIDQLTEMVDRELLADYINEVTTEQIDEKREYLIYGTSDQEIIDGLDEDQVADMQKSFLDGMAILGYDDDTDYIKLLVARDLYVIDLLTDESLNSDQYIQAEEIAEKYAEDRLGDVMSIVIRFDARSDAYNLMESYQLVEFNQEIRLYTGTTPLGDVPSYKIDDTNTRALTNDELLTFFVQMYNSVYDGVRDALPENSTYSTLVLRDDLTYDFDSLSDISSTLGALLFDSLSTMNEPEDEMYYTYRPFEVALQTGKNYYLVLNLNKTHIDLSDFEGDESDLVDLIGQDLYDNIKQELVDDYLETSTFMTKRLKEYREENGFDIFDYYLELDYNNIVPTDMEPTSFDQSDDVIATLDGEDILVKDLLAYALERKAPLYLIHASKYDILRNLYYDPVYCDDDGNCETDWTQNNSAAMNAHLSEYTSLKESFESSSYSTLYTFEDALYIFYGVKNEDEMIHGYINRTLEPVLIFDYVQAHMDDIVDEIMAFVNDYYDKFFSLNVKHILIYLDENADGTPDDFDEYYAELEDQEAFDLLIEQFDTDMREYLVENDDNLSDLVALYNAATKDDETWGAYKQAGLKLLTENLSSSNSLNYPEVYLTYEEPFVEALTDLYQTYRLEDNVNQSFIYSDGLVNTSYGMHLIKAEKGDYFDLDSAAFTVPDESSYNYPSGLNNDEFRLSESQIEVYLNYEIFAIVSSVVDIEEVFNFEKPDLPDRLESLFELFVKDIYDGYYATATVNMSLITVLYEGKLVDESLYSFFSETELISALQRLFDVYDSQVYADFE